MKLKIVTGYGDFSLSTWGGDIGGLSCDVICGPSHNMLYGLFYFVHNGKGFDYEFVLWNHDPPVFVMSEMDINDGKIKVCGYDDI